MNNILIKNIGELITCPVNSEELGLIKNGAICIKNGLIEEAGKEEKVLSTINKKQYNIIDAANKPVLPGFIDPHTHFVFGGYRADEFSWRLQGISYEEIMEKGGGIVNSVKDTRKIGYNDLKNLSQKRLDSMLSYGVTTVEGKSGYGLDITTEIKQLKVMQELNEEHPLDIIPTFMGAHAIPPEYDKSDKYVNHVINKMLPEIVKNELAEFCDVFCDKGAFSIEQSRNILEKARELGLELKLHADEIAPIGAAELAAELKATSADHLLKVSKQGIKAMKYSNTIPVLLPITAFSLKEEYAPARKLRDSGLPVALATDFNPGSCFSESIPLLLTLSTLYMGLTTTEAIRGLTVNAAKAIKRKDRGSIKPGKKADLIVLDAPSYTHLTYHLGVNCVKTVIKNGKIVQKNN